MRKHITSYGSRITFYVLQFKLTLGIGRGFTGTLKTGFLAFLYAGIACEEAGFTHG